MIVAHTAPARSVVPPGPAPFLTLLAIVLLAPLVKGANRPLPLLLLEATAVGLLLAAVCQHARFELPRTVVAGLAILLGYPLLQLVPLPFAWWAALPGHAPYADIVTGFGPGDAQAGWRGASIVAAATEAGWLALLPPLACFLATLRLPSRHVERLVLGIAVVAGAEALLGLLQVGAGGESVLYLRTERAFGTAVGTFANRNHFAALLAMALPVIVGLVAFDIRHDRHRRHASTDRASHREVLPTRILLFALAVLVLLALLFTRSRAGISSALFGLAGASLLLVRAGGGRTAKLVVPGAVALVALLALAIGIAPIMERLEPQQLRISTDERLGIYAATLRASVAFLPLGSGLSTFAQVLPQFQTDGLGGYVNYAHNDYLQVLLELGIAGPLLVGLLAVGYGARMIELVQRGSRRSFTLLQIAAGIALLPLMLHSLFDFGLHIPAVAAWYATLAGVLFHPGATPIPQGAEPC